MPFCIVKAGNDFSWLSKHNNTVEVRKLSEYGNVLFALLQNIQKILQSAVSHYTINGLIEMFNILYCIMNIHLKNLAKNEKNYL